MARVERDPRLLERTRERLAEWRRNKSVAEHYVDAWTELLSLPAAELSARVLDPTDTGADLRQVSPFAGILTPRERWQILRGATRDGEDRAAR